MKTSPEEEAQLGRLAAEQGVTIPRLMVESALAGNRATAAECRDGIKRTMSEPDGANEFSDGALRIAITGAGVAAERAARAREEWARQAQARSITEAPELQERLAAEQAVARAYLARVEQDAWWRTARPQDVADAWEAAQTWREVDPAAARASDRHRG